MDKQRWEEIESILDKALAFADQQKQNEVIKKACDHNQQLYNQVSALLTSIREAKVTNFLEEH